MPLPVSVMGDLCLVVNVLSECQFWPPLGVNLTAFVSKSDDLAEGERNPQIVLENTQRA